MAVADPNGEHIISLMAVGQKMQRVDFNLKKGEQKTTEGSTISFAIQKRRFNSRF